MLSEGEDGADKALIDKNLNASAHIYNALNERILQNKDADVITCRERRRQAAPRRCDLQPVAGRNREGARAREDRLILEQHRCARRSATA